MSTFVEQDAMDGQSTPAGEGRKGPAVLFVCTANICRSPMAAALFKARLKLERSDWADWRVESAGTWAREGDPAARFTRVVLANRGLDVTDHRSRSVSSSLLDEFNLILTMEPGHKEALQIEFPSAARRIFLLSEMEGEQIPVKDPIGGPLEGFEETARKIDSMLEQGMKRIVALAAKA